MVMNNLEFYMQTFRDYNSSPAMQALAFGAMIQQLDLAINGDEIEALPFKLIQVDEE